MYVIMLLIENAPKIVNKENPTLMKFEAIESIGLLLDFSKLDNEAYNKILNNNNYPNYNNNTYSNYETTYNLEVIIKHLAQCLNDIGKK